MRLGLKPLLLLSLALTCGIANAQNDLPDTPQPQNPQQQPQQAPAQNPDEDKQNENPAQAAAAKTMHVTIQAAEISKKMGATALVKARDWESSWLTGVYVEQGQVMTPLNAKQRMDLYLSQTLTTPGAYMKRMFQAGFDQWRNAPPQWGQGWGAYGARFASREGQFITANSVAALGNAKLGYEPRYDQCQCKGFWPRTRHAIVRNFLTYDSGEQNRVPQLALYGGAFAGGLVSTAWKPHPRNAFAEGGRGMLGQAGWGTLLNFFIEFGGDINRKLGQKKQRSGARD